MSFLAGFLAGLGVAWSALAIWHRFPPFPDIDAEPSWRTGSEAKGYPPPPVTDPAAHTRLDHRS